MKILGTSKINKGFTAWLEANKRLVLNGSNAQRLELSKMVQYSVLNLVGLKVPKTICSTTLKGIIDAAKILKFPIIIKHNRAGMGLGVKLFHNIRELKDYIYGDYFENSVDGITLIQRYIFSPDSSIIRVEFVDKKFLYAVKVNTENGFELCPADECNVDDFNQKTKENLSETFYEDGEIFLSTGTQTPSENILFLNSCVLVNKELNHRVLIKKNDNNNSQFTKCC